MPRGAVVKGEVPRAVVVKVLPKGEVPKVVVVKVLPRVAAARGVVAKGVVAKGVVAKALPRVVVLPGEPTLQTWLAVSWPMTRMVTARLTRMKCLNECSASSNVPTRTRMELWIRVKSRK